MPGAEITLVNPDGDKYAVNEDGNVVVLTRRHEIGHEGGMFSVSGEAVLGDGGTQIFLVQVGAKELHFAWNVAAENDCDYQIFEDPTFSAAGTAVTPVNHNRTSARTLQATLTHTPTTSDNGTEIWEQHIVANFFSAAAVQAEAEFILAPDTDYLIKFESNAASNTTAWQLYFYEDE